MIHVVLADAEIEPTEDGTRILDSHVDRETLAGGPEASRRGRPDIVHSSLVLLLNSEPFMRGELRVAVHTVRDQVLLLGPGSSVPQNYLDFMERLEELLLSGEEGNALRWIERDGQTLDTFVSSLAADAVILLSPRGEGSMLRSLLSEMHHLDVAIIVGAFPEGDFRSDAYALADHVVSLSEEEMTVPSVICELLCALR
jgi:rRNA small subunit pseudouridine methyltransferase Nep1